MKTARPFPTTLSIAIIVVLLSSSSLCQDDVAAVIRKSAEANTRDWAAVPEFDNYERDRNKDGDKTYSVTMLYGTPYERVIAVNGHKLTPDRQKAEQQKYDKALEDRRNESPDQRSKRIAKYQAERNRDHTLLTQMTSAFDFHLLKKGTLDGNHVYVLKATPHKGYRPPDRDSEVLTGMEGMLWVDQQTYQWVKVEAHVTHPVRIEGFLAQVEPGTRFEVERKPVTNDIWLVSHYSMRANAKVLLIFSHNESEDDAFFNYHKANAPPAK